ncbi:MAG: acyl carrier protein [Panacagrimonas sp.]
MNNDFRNSSGTFQGFFRTWHDCIDSLHLPLGDPPMAHPKNNLRGDINGRHPLCPATRRHRDQAGRQVTEPDMKDRSIAAQSCMETLRKGIDRWFERNIGTVPEYGPDTSLIELGMDSLAAAELALDISESLGFFVSDEVVFDHPSVRALGQHLADLMSAGLPNQIAPELAMFPTQEERNEE